MSMTCISFNNTIFQRTSIFRNNSHQTTGAEMLRELMVLEPVLHSDEGTTRHVKAYPEGFGIMTARAIVTRPNNNRLRVGYIFVVRGNENGQLYFSQFWRTDQDVSHRDTVTRWLKNQIKVIARREGHRDEKLAATLQGMVDGAVTDSSFHTLRVHIEKEKFKDEVCLAVEKLGLWDGSSRGKNGGMLMKLKAGRLSLHAKKGREFTCIADIYIRYDVPQDHLDFRTQFTGLTPNMVYNGVTLGKAHEVMHKVCDNKLLIGKNLLSDLKSLGYHHNYEQFDIDAHYTSVNGDPISCEILVKKLWNVDIQSSNNSINKARWYHKLYLLHKNTEMFNSRFLAHRDDY